jgi:hypothetical protein
MAGQSKFRHAQDEHKSMELKKAELGVPLAIDFWRPSTEQEENQEECKKSKDSHATINIPLITNSHQTKHTNTCEQHVKIFKQGAPEKFCAHLHVCNELCTKLGHRCH